jgi:hypothetical protein
MDVAIQITGWIATLPDWQQDLARRASLSIKPSAAELQDSIFMFKAATGFPDIEDPPAPLPLTIEHIPSVAASPSAVLTKIGQLKGVGLVSPMSSIDFADRGVTIIFGGNSSGKSSFVRALKAICYTIDDDSKIRSSIYETAVEAPKAHVEYTIDGVPHVVDTDLVGSHILRLPGVSVFDAACAELYIDDSNTIQYVPTELATLTRLASLQDDIRSVLEGERQTLLANPPSLVDVGEDTPAGVEIRKLDGSDADVERLAIGQLTLEERNRINELRAAIAAADSSSISADAAAAVTDAESALAFSKKLEDLFEKVSGDNARTVANLAVDVEKAKAALQLARDQFDTAPMSGIGSEPWVILWGAARSFAESQGVAFPPSEGTTCPLCLQNIDEEAEQRLAHFEAHVLGEVNTVAEVALNKLEVAIGQCDPGQVEDLTSVFLTQLKVVVPDLASEIEVFLAVAKERLSVITTTPTSVIQEVERPSVLIASVEAWGEARRKYGEDLKEAANPTGLVQMKLEFRALLARRTIEVRMGEFKEWSKKLNIATLIDGARTALATNKISTQQRQISEDLVGDALQAALLQELDHLGCGHLPVSINLKVEKAEASAKLNLLAKNPGRLSEIFSEGERRAVALSFFFAELEVQRNEGGVVLDDPVSSLDDERREWISKRLVKEGQHRQVVVFTHDLPFVCDLQSHAESEGVPLSVKGIWRTREAVGFVDENPPMRTMKLKERVNVLKVRVQEWNGEPRATTQEEQWNRVNNFYNDLRTAWERAVEERLFRGVVERFRRDIKTLSLREVQVTPELKNAIKSGMERASFFVHDAPSAGGVPLPDRDRLQEDLELLVNFEAMTR